MVAPPSQLHPTYLHIWSLKGMPKIAEPKTLSMASSMKTVIQPFLFLLPQSQSPTRRTEKHTSHASDLFSVIPRHIESLLMFCCFLLKPPVAPLEWVEKDSSQLASSYLGDFSWCLKNRSHTDSKPLGRLSRWQIGNSVLLSKEFPVTKVLSFWWNWCSNAALVLHVILACHLKFRS